MGKFLQAKRIISIIVALGIGALAIGIASGVNMFQKNEVSYQKGDMSPTDSSWKEGLLVIPQTSTKKTFVAGIATSTTGEATTTTDRIARELLMNYALLQTKNATTTMSDEEAQVLAQTLSERALSDTRVPTYTAQNITVVDATPQTIISYKKETSAALDRFARENTISELGVVAQAIDANSEKKLAPLTQVIPYYQKLIKTLLAIKTPRPFVSFHLAVLQSYATMLSGVTDMTYMISDPLRGFRGIAKYKSGGESLIRSQDLFPVDQ